jgi:hypothetical protein
MPDILDLQVFGGTPGPQPTSDPVEQKSHAAAPTAFSFKKDAKTVVLALLGFYILIYALHIIERKLRG